MKPEELNPEDVTVPPNDHYVVIIKSQTYFENTIRGLLQLIDPLHDERVEPICAAIVTLYEGTVKVQINIFTDQPYKLKKVLHNANYSVMTPEQM